ncbi:MAG: hypothetical protein LWW87_04525 [Geobacteraceae bacterium]|nr:hypothetical protein [Geobacteraceae bacterium]
MFIALSSSVPAFAGVQLIPAGSQEQSVFPEQLVALEVLLRYDQPPTNSQSACNLNWSSSPRVAFPASTSPRLLLLPNSLQPGVDYLFRVDAVCADSAAFSEFRVHVMAHPAPYGGSCNVSPSRGYADGVTPFRISTEGWQEAVKTGVYMIKPDGTALPLVPMSAGASKQLVTKLDYQGEQPIRLECRAENIAGLSAKAQTTVTVLLANGQTGVSNNQLTVLCNPTKLSRNQMLRLFATVKSISGATVNGNAFSYRWDVSPAVPISLPQGPVVTLPPQQMQQLLAGQRYTFTARVKESSASELTASCTVNLIAPPFGGNCVAAWQTRVGQPPQLRISTANWQSDQDALPLYYQFYYAASSSSKVALSQALTTPSAIIPVDSAIAQNGGNIICVVRNTLGDVAQAVAVLPPAPRVQLNPPTPVRIAPRISDIRR